MTRSALPLVYAAHPITSYGTPHERAALKAIRRLLPDVRVLDPSVLYVSPSHWLAEWPTLAPTLQLIVLFGDEAGSIGAGCMKEVADGIAHGVEVYVLRHGSLRELVSLRLLPMARGTPASCAIPVAGRAVTLELSTSRGARLRGSRQPPSAALW